MSDPLDDSVLEYLRSAIRSLMNDRADHIAGGACDDFADYKKQVGVIEGLAMAEREILDLAERLKQADQ